MKYEKSWPPAPYGCDEETRQAMEVVREAIAEFRPDPSRPKLHFTPPAKEMLDTWGGILIDGWYHVFYGLNTTREKRIGGSIGHIRSRNLLDWELLPLALVPSVERDEFRLNDGCVVITNDGPLMYYTSVFNDGNRHREHVPVRGSADLINWQRLAERAITIANHGGPEFAVPWSDAFIFSTEGRTFMLIAKCVTPQGENRLPIYEAVDDSLLDWKYRGIFLNDTGEVVNFVRLGAKWVLIHCPYSNPVYLVGDFDLDSGRFHVEKKGVLSYGYVCQGDENSLISRGFYATTTFEDDSGRTAIFGWLTGFYSPQGWDGGMSFPRVLELDDELNLKMLPHPVLGELRQKEILRNVNGSWSCGRCFEIECKFSLRPGGKIVWRVGDELTLTITESEVRLNDITAPLSAPRSLRLFVDVSVAELFCNDGQCCISRAFPALSETVEMTRKSEGVEFTNTHVYQLGHQLD